MSGHCSGMPSKRTPLAELHAEWVEQRHRIVGMRFVCPNCRACTIGVLFENPPDGGPPASDDKGKPHNNGGRRWHRTGETLETLTLRPSIDASSWGCWHGEVTSGVAHLPGDPPP